MAQQVNFTRIDEAVVTRACEVLDLICRRGLSVVTAESCTGGLFGEAGRAEVRYQAVMAALALLERAV